MIHIRIDISIISVVLFIVTAFYLFMAWLFYKGSMNITITKFHRFSFVVFWPFWLIFGLSLIVLEKIPSYIDNFKLKFKKVLDKISKE